MPVLDGVLAAAAVLLLSSPTVVGPLSAPVAIPLLLWRATRRRRAPRVLLLLLAALFAVEGVAALAGAL